MRQFTRAKIAELITYLNGGQIPSFIGKSSPSIQFFKSKYTPPDWTAAGPHLLYRGWRVIAAKDITNFIQGLYNDPATRVNGRDRFYAKIQELSHGITNKQVMEFLKLQELYQLHNQVTKDKVVKPLVPAGPNKHWQIDTIVMYKPGNFSGESTRNIRPNRGFAYILTIIDCFTKYAWAIPLKKATEDEVIEALKSIFAGEGVIPAKIQSDKGFEFGQGATNSKFVKFLHKNNITHTTSAAYTPSSQGCVERFNKTLKSMIAMGKTASGSEVWFDKFL